MKVLLVSCYDIDAGPPSFYSVFDVYARLCEQFHKLGWQPLVLSDRKNVPPRYLSLKDQFITIAKIRGRRARVRTAMKFPQQILRSLNRDSAPKIVFSHTVSSLATWIQKNGIQAAIHFGGVRDDSHRVNLELRQSGIPLLFIERGWLPQAGTLYFDPAGTNYRSTIPFSARAHCSEDAVFRCRQYLSTVYTRPTSTDGPVVVALQLEQDANNRYFSPFFHSNRYFLKYLSAHLEGENVVFCPHPLEAKLEKRSSQQKYGDLERPGFKLVPKGINTIDLVPAASLVIGINSTILIEALACGKKVVAYGNGVFSGNGAVLEADVNTSREEILGYVPDSDAVDRFLSRLLAVQFPMNDISKLVSKIERMVCPR